MWALTLNYILEVIILPFSPLVLFCGIIRKIVPEIGFRLVLLSIGLGLACFPIIVLLQSFLPSLPTFSVSILFLTATIEELIKAFSLYFLPRKKIRLPAFFWLSFIVGLTLGSFETIAYHTTEWHMILLRTVTAVSLHAVCTALASFFIGTSESQERKKSPLVIAILLHFLYNLFASFSGLGTKLLMIACILVGAVLCFQYYRVSLKNSVFRDIP